MVRSQNGVSLEFPNSLTCHLMNDEHWLREDVLLWLAENNIMYSFVTSIPTEYKHGSMMITVYESKNVISFNNDTDAMHFKLRWL